MRDPNFTIWEGARAEATGYSFPSGHSQNAVGAFGSLALWNRRKRAALIVFPILAVLFCLLLAAETWLSQRFYR